MKKFNIFRNSDGEVQAVKQGWCWPAFFFSFIWAIVSKMWWLGISVFLGYIVLKIILGSSAEVAGLSNIVLIIIKIIFAANGNKWREKDLVSKGFELQGEVESEDKNSALALHALEAGREQG